MTDLLKCGPCELRCSDCPIDWTRFAPPEANEVAAPAVPMTPTYYVRHPDGTISIAQPQPSAEQIASQRDVYAQCDRQHSGGVCCDPGCHVAPVPRVVDPIPLPSTTP